MRVSPTTRRAFIKKSAAATVAGGFGLSFVPSRVLGFQNDAPPPSETLGGALIGVGGQGPNTFKQLGKDVRMLAQCDVKFVGREDNDKIYSDFRRVLDRKDIDVIAIATPPHWHALISIAAAQAGKDVVCEKPMTRFIAEGRAVVNAFKRYGRIFQIGTFGRFNASRDRGNIEKHKIMQSGILNPCPVVHHHKGGLKVKEWSGRVNVPPKDPPASLNWDLYTGPAPVKSYVPPRTGGTHRGYWDYEGGGLADMAQHSLDPLQWIYAKDDTSPVSIEAYAPPAHPEVCAMWGWIELKYADGMTLVMESGEWGKPYDRLKARDVGMNTLSPGEQQKIRELPDPAPLVTFSEAVKTRKQSGGNAEAAHRCATLLHLSNIAIRTGRKIQYDPVKEIIIDDEQANRLVNVPMRAPWSL